MICDAGRGMPEFFHISIELGDLEDQCDVLIILKQISSSDSLNPSPSENASVCDVFV